MRMRTLALLLLAGVTFSLQAYAKPIEAAGKIEAVTVYRGQALITRAIAVDVPAGLTKVVVPGLPAEVIGSSLTASTEGDLQIQAVRYRVRAIMDSPREDVAKLNAAIQDVNKLLRKNAAAAALVRQKEAYLVNLEKFSADKAKDDLNKGTLNGESLEKLSDYIFKQRAELSTQAFDLAEEAQTQKEKLDLLQRQLAELVATGTKTAREAVIFINRKDAGAAALKLNYLVQGANWTPSYNLRSEGPGKDVGLEYYALVQQASGEDWNGVKLTLSTAMPTMTAEAPILTPLWVSLAGGAPVSGPMGYYDGSNMSVTEAQRAANAGMSKALSERKPQAQAGERLNEDWAANKYANQLQLLDLVGSREALLSNPKDSLIAGGALAVTYALPGELSVASRDDQQMVRIASLKLKGDFYYLAVPVLTPYVYQQADIVNTSDVALLSGPVSSYMDGQFTGTGRIPIVARGQSFTVGFGVDTQLRARRELVDKSEAAQGGNKVLTFKYRLALDNYKDKVVTIRVLDRLPDPKNADIKVTLGTPSVKISEDPLYQSTLRKSGILRWDVEVPAKSSGDKAKTIDYDFKLEFDRNTHLAEPAAEIIERNKKDFQRDLELQAR